MSRPTVRPPEVIDLQRLRLRRPRLSDAAAIFEYASDAEVARYADWPISASLASVTERLRAREAEWNAGTEFHWVATLPPDDRAIGAIACTISGHAAEFGFLFARRFWRNGYATEAARAIVDWIFLVPSVWRLSATCDSDNRASARVLEKAGLTRLCDVRSFVRTYLAHRAMRCSMPRYVSKQTPSETRRLARHSGASMVFWFETQSPRRRHE